MTQQPFFFLIVVLDDYGYELKFAVHDTDETRFLARVDLIMTHIKLRGYTPVQSHDAWRNTLEQQKPPF